MAMNYKNLQQIVARLNEAEHNFCMQRAKVSYFKQVDRNSSIFHALVKRNNKWKEITTIEQPDGSLTTSFAEVVQAFMTYFQSQLGTTTNRIDFPQ